MLAKKDREQVQRDRDLKEREEALSAREATFKAAKEDPFAFIEKELGVTYDAWTERLVKGPKPVEKDPVAELQGTVEKMQKEAKAKEEAEAAAKLQSEHDRALNDFRGGVKAEIAKNESLELCRIMGDEAVEQAVAVVRAHVRKTGELLPLAEALSLVEGFYEESGSRFLQSKKLTARLSSSTPEVQKPAPAVVQKPSQTITSKVAPTTPAAEPPKNERERWNQLYAKRKGTIFK